MEVCKFKFTSMISEREPLWKLIHVAVLYNNGGGNSAPFPTQFISYKLIYEAILYSSMITCVFFQNDYHP